MAEYKDMITAKELRTLEIDLENNVLRLNGDDLKHCKELSIHIDFENCEVSVKTDLWTSFVSSKRRNPKSRKSIKESG